MGSSSVGSVGPELRHQLGKEFNLPFDFIQREKPLVAKDQKALRIELLLYGGELPPYSVHGTDKTHPGVDHRLNRRRDVWVELRMVQRQQMRNPVSCHVQCRCARFALRHEPGQANALAQSQ
jgi:hypothetical protein